MVSRWLLIGCVLAACAVPDKNPSDETSNPGEVPGAAHDAGAPGDGPGASPVDAPPDAGQAPGTCSNNDDDDCEDEPPPVCLDAYWRLKYKDGRCIAGACVYAQELRFCDKGCAGGECE